jgi:putative FmdB family regulatory protein
VPVYDYVCSSCHRLTEVVHGITADGPHFCPECGAEGTMTKVFSAPSVHFKGSGWAKKDRSSSSRSAARSKESGGDSKTDGSKSDGSSSDGGGSSSEGSSSADKATPKKVDGGAASNASTGSGSSSGSGASASA